MTSQGNHKLATLTSNIQSNKQLDAAPSLDIACNGEAPAASYTEAKMGSLGEVCAPKLKVPLFSVIMPLYNAQDFVDKACAQILNQTCPDFEFLLIDDASTDNTAKKLQEWDAQDERIRIITCKNNGGPARARNLGLKHAQGCYIWMPDCDDSLDERILEKCADRLKDHPSCNMVVFGVQERYWSSDNSHVAHVQTFTNKIDWGSSPQEHAQALLELELTNTLGYPTNKIYAAALIRHAQASFEPLPLLEDFFFNIKLLDKVSCLQCIPEALYGYEKRNNNSLTQRFVPEYYAIHRRKIAELVKLMAHFKASTPQNDATIGSLWARYILSALERNCSAQSGMNRYERRAFLHSIKADPDFCRLIGKAHAQNSRVLDLWIAILKWPSTTPALSFAWLVSVLKRHAQPTFNRIKSQR